MSNNNYLHGVDGTWVGDEAVNTSVEARKEDLVQDGWVVKASSSPNGNPLSLMLRSPSTNDDNSTLATATSDSFSCYYEIQIQELTGSLSLGVVQPSLFQPGFRMRAMMCNGSLFNGMVRLLNGYSNVFAQGDTVGVLCVQQQIPVEDGTTTRHVKVVFYLNGRCLGVAFELEEKNSQELYMPCCHVEGQVSFLYQTPLNKSVPSSMERQAEVRLDPYSGDWKLVKALRKVLHSHKFVPFAIKADVMLKLTPTRTNGGGGGGINTSPDGQATEEDQENNDNEFVGTVYELQVKVFNVLQTDLTIMSVAKHDDDSLVANQQEAETASMMNPPKVVEHVVQLGHVFNTMMMPPLGMVSTENYITKSLDGFHKLSVPDGCNGTTLLVSCHAAEWTLERFTQTFSPVNNYK